MYIDRTEKTLLIMLIAWFMAVAIFWQVSKKNAADPPLITEIDSYTGLSVVGHSVFYLGQLPDGHYTLAKILSSGEAILIQHQPGPDRNFVYYHPGPTGFLSHLQTGQQFTLFRGKVV